jgi:hypothetical protein
VADLPTAGLPAPARVEFSFRWQETGRWEGKDYSVQIPDTHASGLLA